MPGGAWIAAMPETTKERRRIPGDANGLAWREFALPSQPRQAPRCLEELQPVQSPTALQTCLH